MPVLSYGLIVDSYSAGVVLGQLLFQLDEADVTDDEDPGAKGDVMVLRIGAMQARKDPELSEAHDLALRLLDADPATRLSVTDALRHPYFAADCALPPTLPRDERRQVSERLETEATQWRRRLRKERQQQQEAAAAAAAVPKLEVVDATVSD
jgi:serine/threonine protein kinase